MPPSPVLAASPLSASPAKGFSQERKVNSLKYMCFKQCYSLAQPGPLNALDGVTYHNGSSLFLIGGERADNMVSAPVERVALGKSFL